jgi:hypothetical protein
VQGAVAGQPGDADPVQDGAVDHPAAPAGDEVVEVDDHVEVGAVPTPGLLGLVIEKEPGHLDQGVVAALGRAAGRFPLDIGGLGQLEGPLHQRVPLRGQRPVEDAGAVQAR